MPRAAIGVSVLERKNKLVEETGNDNAISSKDTHSLTHTSVN